MKIPMNSSVRYSIGYAFRGGNKDAMLQLHSSETSDAQPCKISTRYRHDEKNVSVWIYKLGPEGKDPFGNSQYEYAVVSNWVKYPVTVLVRDPDTFKAKYQKEVEFHFLLKICLNERFEKLMKDLSKTRQFYLNYFISGASLARRPRFHQWIHPSLQFVATSRLFELSIRRQYI